MRTNIQLGYVLGASSLLAAVVYFYASNWGELGRFGKFAPLFAVIAGLYGLSAVLAGRPGRQFLSRLSLLSCCICFGIGVALVGQTYNSHADSFSLYAIWLIPALGFAIVTRWQPFYVLAYILTHLAYLFYFFPESGNYHHTELMKLLILLLLAGLNAALYVLTEKKRLVSSVIQFLSFSMTFGLLLYMSVSFNFETYGWIMNIPLAALLFISISHYHRTRNKMFLLLSGLWVSAFVVVKYSELAFHYFDEAFIWLGMIFVILFVWGNVKFLGYLRSLALEDEDRVQEEANNEQHPTQEQGAYIKWMTRVLSAAVIIIGTILGSVTLVGFMMMIVDIDHPEYALAGIGVIAAASMIAAQRLNSIVRYTLLTGGLTVGIGASVAMDSLFLLFIFLGITMTALAFISGVIQRMYFFIAGELIISIILNKLMHDEVLELAILGGLLLLICVTARFITSRPQLQKPLLYSGYPSFLLVFFVLTFVTDDTAYYVCNALFFLTVTLALVVSRQASAKWVYAVSLAFWIAFLVYKYYDIAWKLLHKSFSLAFIGIAILLLTAWYEKTVGHAANSETHPLTGSKFGGWLIAALVIAQLAVMSVQIARSEHLLANGQVIKLELAPLDPRSLLQGDFVRLRYAISEPGISETTKESYSFRKKITVVLAPDASGVYQFRRIDNGTPLQAGEVRLNAKWDGCSEFLYGIETYFIPEGTGLEVERNTKFAEVKVSSGGDAILVRLLGE